MLNGTTNVLIGGSVSFGSVQVGGGVNRTPTIRNSGLEPRHHSTCRRRPARRLFHCHEPGEHYARVRRFDNNYDSLHSNDGRNDRGCASHLSNDADEGSFVINFTGSATCCPRRRSPC